LLGLTLAILFATPPARAQQPATTTTAAPNGPRVRVVGTVRDQQNAISLPGVPVEVVGTSEVVYTDVDGKYVLDLPPGAHELKVTMDGYQERRLKLDVVAGTSPTVDVALPMQGFTEQLTVAAAAVDAASSSAEAQLIERKNANVISDNMGALEMRANGDSDAAAAMQRVTGLSVVDNQYVFVRGLGERYSNTTLAGSTIPTTEPDKKVVPLDLFPTGLIDSVQIAKSYSADKSADFAGGLVQIVPLKFPSRPTLDLSWGMDFYSNATGEDIILSPLGSRDWLGFDDGARAMPAIFPDSKIVRRGIYTPDVGFSPDEITTFGRALENTWRPTASTGDPGQNWSVVYGNRFGKLGVIASASQSYKEQYLEEQRAFYRVEEGSELGVVSDYQMQTGTQRAQLGIVGNVAYQFTPNHRLALENFYTHSGRDEGRYFEGPNFENNQYYRNYRVQFIEEGLFSNGVTGEHFFQDLSNSRLDWRVNFGRASRDEPDLREYLQQQTLTANGTGSGQIQLADESQSGFRMFNTLDDETLDVAGNWSMLLLTGGRPTQLKFGASYTDRARDFVSRRFRFIPITTGSGNSGIPAAALSLPPEELYASENIGRWFRFNEETRPTDLYDADLKDLAVYGMGDFSLSSRLRLVAGARIEDFEQTVVTQDPFGLFQSEVLATNNNTDFFPAVNLVYAMRHDMNFRASASQTVNRPEFRELAPFEFTDVVGNRAVRGNPELTRALIQNYDVRWERISGGRNVMAASFFAKTFTDPIERVIIAAAQPIASFENAESARNLGIELEVGQQLAGGFFVGANYSFIDSQITISEAARQVQTSTERPLQGQSKNLFNGIVEYAVGGFSTRLLYNYFDDRIADVGANGAPDIIEEGRGRLDLVFSQRLGRLGLRVNLENLTDSSWLFTQGAEDQRRFKLGRTFSFTLGYTAF
jgi:TonB-dependent receptor